MKLKVLWIAGLMLAATAGQVQAGFIVADYTTIADGTAASFSLGGTTVTGSNTLNSALFNGFRGIGVTGGGASLSLDLGETMTIDYGQLVTNVTLGVVDIEPPGNVSYQFEAFNGATSLGLFSVPSHSVEAESKNLTLLASGQSFSKVTLSLLASAPLGLQIQNTTYDVYGAAPVPEPASIAMWSLGGLGMMFARRKRQQKKLAA